jgi:hypothetical protein
VNARSNAGLLIYLFKSTGCGRPLKADNVSPLFYLPKPRGGNAENPVKE